MRIFKYNLLVTFSISHGLQVLSPTLNFKTFACEGEVFNMLRCGDFFISPVGVLRLEIATDVPHPT